MQAPGTYDRVVSVEMFEHMKNYAELMRRVSTWLRPGGALFVHIFCHKTTPYHFEVRAGGRGGGGQRRVRVCVFGGGGGQLEVQHSWNAACFDGGGACGDMQVALTTHTCV